MKAVLSGISDGLAMSAGIAFILGNYTGGFAYLGLAIYLRIPRGAK